jgi:hypothetical protein
MFDLQHRIVKELNLVLERALRPVVKKPYLNALIILIDLLVLIGLCAGLFYLVRRIR